jgi:hypothetical protein
MPERRNLSILRNEVHHGDSSIGAVKVVAAVALLGLGAGLFFMLPDSSGYESHIASASNAPQDGAAANAPQNTAAADETFCDKQAWPYVDQRCAKRVEAARGTRQVRIVTDKGHSVTTVTPLPVVEPKPKAAPPAPTIAQAEKPIGPPVAPAAAPTSPPADTVAAAPQAAPASQGPAPKTAATPAPSVQAAVAPPNRPDTNAAKARENPNPPADARIASVSPSAASNAPVARGVDAFGEAPPPTWKSARAAEKAERRAMKKAEREAKRRSLEDNDGGLPEDVVGTVKSDRNSRANRRGVPDDVVRAVEEASAADARRGRIVTIGSPNGGQRIYLVPREQVSGW